MEWSDMTRIFDACTFPYDRDSWQCYFDRLIRYANEYFGRFGALFAAQFDVDHDDYRRVLASGGPAAASALLLDHAKPFDVGEYLAAREREGVVAEIALGAPGTPNDHVIDLARQVPGRIHAWAGLSLTDAGAVLAELRRCLEAGVTGVFIAPVLDGIDITHDRFADVLGLAAERHLAVYLHTGQHFVRAQPLDITTWRHVDTLASRYPDLRIVCGHAGWPWVLETLLVAARHDNVYLDISGHRPSRMATPGFGWEPLITLGSSSLRHRILFGTCSWLSPQPANLLATEVADLVGDDVAADWLHNNTQRLLEDR
jgi:predicted TIM-barrel fold metal-dependent hydrolase